MGRVFHGVEVINTNGYNNITLGKIYRILRIGKEGLIIKNNIGKAVYYPNKCFF